MDAWTLRLVVGWALPCDRLARRLPEAASALGKASGRLYRRGMSSFDYNAPAELFLSKPAKGSRTKYRRFATAAEALRYAVEDLRMPKAFGAWLEVGDARFDSIEIQRLYEANDYPLRKPQ
jgi:hypothetical protein